MGAVESEEGGVQTLIEHSAAPKDRTVLAVHKIRTIESEGARHIIFSVVGFVLHCLVTIHDINMSSYEARQHYSTASGRMGASLQPSCI